MTATIQDRAAKAQSEHFEGFGEVAPQIVERTQALYDNVAALTEDQRLTLAMQVLIKISHMVDAFGDSLGDPIIAAHCAKGHALMAVAGVAVESLREEKGYTSTGDKKVDDVLSEVNDLLTSFADSRMTDDQKAAAAEVRTRVKAGEDFDTVVSEVMEKYGIDMETQIGEDTGAASVPAATVQGSTPKGDTGLYL